jgi:hypothetical protein
LQEGDVGKRKPIQSIVEDICTVGSARTSITWIDRLPKDVLEVCMQTKNRVVQQDLPHYVVSENLAQYLHEKGIQITATTIGKWLAKCKKSEAKQKV